MRLEGQSKPFHPKMEPSKFNTELLCLLAEIQRNGSVSGSVVFTKTPGSFTFLPWTKDTFLFKFISVLYETDSWPMSLVLMNGGSG